MVDTKIFFRNDDIRDKLDESLDKITKLFIDNQIPIAHAVEPGNVSNEVVEWLLNKKKEHPSLIEIIQHGYNHKIKIQNGSGEFGGGRNYKEQYQDIKAGMDLMNRYFGDNWLRFFTYPYGRYNSESMAVLNDLGYSAISTSIKYNLKSKMKDFSGRLLKQDLFLGKAVSYHNIKRKNYKFREFDISINLIKKYTGYDTAIHFDENEIIHKVEKVSRKTPIIGILLHHRFHTNYIKNLENLLGELASRKYRFVTLSMLIKNEYK